LTFEEGPPKPLIADRLKGSRKGKYIGGFGKGGGQFRKEKNSGMGCHGNL